MNKIGIYIDKNSKTIEAVFYSGRYTTLYCHMSHESDIEGVASVISDGINSEILFSMDTDEFNKTKELLFYVDSND